VFLEILREYLFVRKSVLQHRHAQGKSFVYLTGKPRRYSAV
jgi:hypothetical protein